MFDTVLAALLLALQLHVAAMKGQRCSGAYSQWALLHVPVGAALQLEVMHSATLLVWTEEAAAAAAEAPCVCLPAHDHTGPFRVVLVHMLPAVSALEQGIHRGYTVLHPIAETWSAAQTAAAVQCQEATTVLVAELVDAIHVALVLLELLWPWPCLSALRQGVAPPPTKNCEGNR